MADKIAAKVAALKPGDLWRYQMTPNAYHNRAIATPRVIELLIKLAKR